MDCESNRLACRGGLIFTDKEEFCEQIRLCERAMYSVAFSVLRNESDAAEVLSEAIYRAYKSLDTLKSESSFKPWVLKIVHNTAVEQIRKNAGVISMEEISDLALCGTEEKLTTNLTLKDAVNSLKQPYRTAVILFYYENLSILKIAQITSTTPAAVKKRLSRARNMLKELLKEDFNNE